MSNIIIVTLVVAFIIFIIFKFTDFIKLNNPDIFFHKSLDDIFFTSELKKKLYDEFSSLIHKVDIDYKNFSEVKYRIYLAWGWQNGIKDENFLKKYKWIDYQNLELNNKFLHGKFQETINSHCMLLQDKLETKEFKESLLRNYVLHSKDVDKFIFISFNTDETAYSKIKRRYTKILNAGLIDSVRHKTAKSVSKDEVEETTIIGMMIGKKIKRDTRAYILLFLGLIIYLLAGLFITQINLFGVIFFALAILALQLNQKVTEYRIRNGYYGTNFYEAREIIQFVVENADDNFYSGGKIKKFMPDPETMREEVNCVEGGVYA